MGEDRDQLLRLLRLEMTAVHQQFFHMLALRQWQDEALLPRLNEVDTADFKNALKIAEWLIAAGHPLRLEEQRFQPGSDLPSMRAAEQRMEREMAALLADLTVSETAARDLVAGAMAARVGYLDWLAAENSGAGDGQAGDATDPALAVLLAELIVLIEQAMLHAFVQWHRGTAAAADTAWRLSGAAMIYATALVKQGVATGTVPQPGPVPPIVVAETCQAAIEADRQAAGRVIAAARRGAAALGDAKMARLCRRIAEDCTPLAEAFPDEAFPASFGSSPVFESFAETRERHLGL